MLVEVAGAHMTVAQTCRRSGIEILHPAAAAATSAAFALAGSEAPQRLQVIVVRFVLGFAKAQRDSRRCDADMPAQCLRLV